jgi:hypothetical protein
MGLEEELYGCKQIRNFLKLFSEHNWNKVSKATLMIGICRLNELSMREIEGFKPVNQMSVEDLESLAVKMMAKTLKKQKTVEQSERMKYQRPETAPIRGRQSPESGLRSSLKRSPVSPSRASHGYSNEFGQVIP